MPRSALSTLEMVVLNGDMEGDTIHVTREGIEQCISQKSLLYDKNGEEHYNLISALHKSMRNSDPDAALYWLARMLEAGEDPLYVARRVTRFASEDIGAGRSARAGAGHRRLSGVPFSGHAGMRGAPLAGGRVPVGSRPKSNALYVGYERAKGDALQELADPVPLALRNAPTRLMRELDYGKGYQYAHDAADKLTNLQCLPDSKLGKRYYRPTTQGLEARFAARLADHFGVEARARREGGGDQASGEEESLEEPAPSRQVEKRPVRRDAAAGEGTDKALMDKQPEGTATEAPSREQPQ